ncbi:MAG: SDR family oxidoreductase [Pseudomonadota bacterium]
MDKFLEGQVAVVSGSALNIGREICVQLAQHGASVVTHARSDREGAEKTAELVREAGGQAATWIGDLTEPEGAKALIQTAIDAFGKITILVNNAAIRGNDRLEDIPLEKFQRILATNLQAHFLCAQAAVPHIEAQGGGRIVNIGGLAGHRGVPLRAHVATSKAGLMGMTTSMAAELAEKNITVNIVVPGMIDTIRGASAGGAPHIGHPNMLHRDGAPAEVAHWVTALCHPNGGYVTGQTIHVNGGAYTP